MHHERHVAIKEGRNNGFMECYCTFYFCRSLYMNYVGLTVIIGLSCVVGVVVFARYHDCDPILSGVCNLLNFIVMDGSV